MAADQGDVIGCHWTGVFQHDGFGVAKNVEKAIENLKHNLVLIRTGRPDPAILNKVKIDYYSVQTPLSQVANISIQEGTQLYLKPYDKSILKELLEQNKTLIDKLTSIANEPKIVNYQNCNNKKMTVNVYLNEKCKDAMNLSDFIQKLQITLDDLYYTKQNGFAKGISNIFVKHLADLNPTERPIHCSDKEKDQEIKNIKRNSKKLETTNSEKTTLGDLDALANLKEKMEDDK